MLFGIAICKKLSSGVLFVVKETDSYADKTSIKIGICSYWLKSLYRNRNGLTLSYISSTFDFSTTRIVLVNSQPLDNSVRFEVLLWLLRMITSITKKTTRVACG